MGNDRAQLDAVRLDRGALVAALQDAGATVSSAGSLKCLFHEDGTASAKITQFNGGPWKLTCFGCDWNDGKRTGDVFDVLKRTKGLDFAGSLAYLGPKTTPTPAPPNRKRPTGPSPSTFDAGKYAADAAARLAADPVSLSALWSSRAIGAEAAARLGIGISADGRYWTFPVADVAGRVVAVKHHRASPDVEPKCLWDPKGTESKQLWPIDLAPEGPVWLAPGELKAAAIIDAGAAAVGITGGEGSPLPERAVELLRGRQVGIIGDDDEKGRDWVAKAIATLSAAEIDVRKVDVGLDAASGVKDVGDWLLRQRIENDRDEAAVRATLSHAFAAADPFAPYTLANIWADSRTWVAVPHFPTGFRKLDEALGGIRVGSTSLFVGRSGKGKTQLVTQIAANAARAGIPCGFISLEMSRGDIAKLIACGEARVARTWIDKGTIHGEASVRFHEAMKRCKDIPLTVFDEDYFDGAATRSTLRDAVAAGVKRFGWQIVVVDYLGLLAPEDDDRTEYDSDVKNSTTIKRIARKEGVAILCIADLRKAGTFKTTARKPQASKRESVVTLDDVRGSSRLCYDAVNVFFISGTQVHAPHKEPTGIITLTALKTRFAGMGSRNEAVNLRWYPSSGHICDLESELNGETPDVCAGGYDPESDGIGRNRRGEQ